VFALTAGYDAMIRDYFAGEKPSAMPAALPEKLTMEFVKAADLRYGENPHQKAVLYRDKASRARGVIEAEKLNGKELSFNNILDLDAALEMATAFDEPACAIMKHTSPCGFAIGKDALSAFKAAHACDPLSAFGGIVGFNRGVDGKTAKAILASGFLECVIAESFTAEALELLRTKKNLRLLATGKSDVQGMDFKKVRGGLLYQEPDLKDPSAADLKTATKSKPTKSRITDLLLAFKICRYVKSNAIVIVKNGVTVGLGMGQPSRVDSCLTAFRKAGKRAKGAVLASDGFFPKPDSIALAKKAGIAAIIQPGGSIQDEEVTKACDKARIPMVFAGIRHFRH
jgi:phosphoribosylaminoimidazolecarboxamide formyltransferase/IMP cyclohydrolase